MGRASSPQKIAAAVPNQFCLETSIVAVGVGTENVCIGLPYLLPLKEGIMFFTGLSVCVCLKVSLTCVVGPITILLKRYEWIKL